MDKEFAKKIKEVRSLLKKWKNLTKNTEDGVLYARRVLNFKYKNDDYIVYVLSNSDKLRVVSSYDYFFSSLEGLNNGYSVIDIDDFDIEKLRVIKRNIKRHITKKLKDLSQKLKS